MSANIKASVDGTQAIIGVGGVDQMTVSNAGVVTANSFVGSASSATALATGSTTARTLANRFADVVNAKDFGADPTGVVDSGGFILNAFNASNGKRIYFPAGTYLIATPLSAPNGSKAYMEAGSSFATNTPTNVDYVWEQYNTAPVAGSIMQIDKLIENSNYPLKNEGGLWPHNTYTYFGISKEMTPTTVPNTVFQESPATNTFVYTTNTGVLASALGLMSDINGETADSKSFAANFIARNGSGATNTKLVGLEIDIQPAIGTTVSGETAGLYINAFTLAGCGSAIQIDGVSGGKFSNGVVINNIKSDGAAFADIAGLSCQYGLALTNGTYSFAAIALNADKYIRFWGNDITKTTRIYSDTDDHLNISLYKDLLVTATDGTENVLIAAFRNYDGNSPVRIFTADAFGFSSAATAMSVGKNSTTNRSINAGGTINASGADYAEYEIKNSTCGVVAKGQVIGFDSNGHITDKWNDSVSFGVKSTNPNIVGGDTWGSSVGNPPQEPSLPVAAKAKPEKQQSIRSQYSDAIEEEYQKAILEWEADVARYESEMDSYNAKKTDYDLEFSKWQENLETARQVVDRIAYCGKTPVNVFGASVGDYIIPEQDGDGITAIAVKTPTLNQYQVSVGRVRKILEDGRSEIVVKPI
jgi:hypothetical protein